MSAPRVAADALPGCGQDAAPGDPTTGAAVTVGDAIANPALAAALRRALDRITAAENSPGRGDRDGG